ncbi:hypothetical protein GA707_17385 [Nostocoides sp. F2B08]|uniref:hypothetical protein n=1 Tax=Nostocoides sp. F2B08 TaxID=2653936 RepID=UPI0012637D81|nr:hypothetical protein [Tetrasphaera sp. F2B08]KAB7741965.1 hypothetical protein GA707_17385 [Tetrasphaera sp. F2B08]
MTFNIGSQNAGVVNNVAGNQRIEGGQYGTLVTTEDALHAVSDLRAALDRVTLDQNTAVVANEHVDEIESELHSEPEPDRARVAQALERLTRLLTAAGAVATAGAALLGPLQALAGWLGGLGAPVLALLA